MFGIKKLNGSQVVAAALTTFTETLAELERGTELIKDEMDANSTKLAVITDASKGLAKIYDDTAKATELAKVPKSDGTVTWNVTVMTSVTGSHVIDWKAGFSSLTRRVSQFNVNGSVRAPTGSGPVSDSDGNTADPANTPSPITTR